MLKRIARTTVLRGLLEWAFYEKVGLGVAVASGKNLELEWEDWKSHLMDLQKLETEERIYLGVEGCKRASTTTVGSPNAKMTRSGDVQVVCGWLFVSFDQPRAGMWVPRAGTARAM